MSQTGLSSRDLMKQWLAEATPREIEEWADCGLRHKSGKQPADFLRHWLNVARHFGYATQDDSWGEFEKEFCIIIKRMVVAERDLEKLRAHPSLSQEPLCERCEYCGAEDPTLTDQYLCREKPCRLQSP